MSCSEVPLGEVFWSTQGDNYWGMMISKFCILLNPVISVTKSVMLFIDLDLNCGMSIVSKTEMWALTSQEQYLYKYVINNLVGHTIEQIKTKVCK